MPLVFVHGVANRRGNTVEAQKKFDGAVGARDELFRTIALRGLVSLPRIAHIENPYWGDHAAHFSYDLVTVPSSGVETFGPTDDELSQVLMDTVSVDVARKASGDDVAQDELLLTIARTSSLGAAIDAVVAACAIDAPDDAGAEESRNVADFAAWAARYATSGPDMSWLNARHPVSNLLRVRNDAEFLDALTEQVDEFRGGASTDEAFGSGGVLNRLKHAAGSIATVAKKTVKAIVGVTAGTLVGAGVGAALGGLPGPTLRVLRPTATRRLGTFVGDVFTYLKDRTPIQEIVSAAFDAAVAKTTEADDKLIIVAHSMGGNVVYDMLTSVRSDLHVDLLVTVGSQVGLFKELRLYTEDKAAGAAPATGATPPLVKPAWKVEAWLNVFDPLDALGFAGEGVFEGIKDFDFSTEGSVLNAHSLYFVRPLFHQRLRVRMSELGFGSAQ